MFNRREIKTNHITVLERATLFLHQDYKPEFLWWEPVALVHKLSLTGYVLLLQNDLIRLFTAVCISVFYFAAILFFKPYKRADIVLLACATQLCQITVFVGASIITCFQYLSREATVELAVDLLGFTSSEQVARLMIAAVLTALVPFVGMTAYQISQVNLRARARPHGMVALTSCWD